MPEPDPNIVVREPVAPVRKVGEPITPFTCEWAQDGLQRALNGLGRASAGVSEYHIGTRGLHYNQAGNQLKTVDWWAKMVEYFCGESPLPSVVTGRETACRIIPRDL